MRKVNSNSISDWRRFALGGYALIFFTFGVAGGWAAIAKLDRAVVASGVVSVESNHKTLQHLEGGIVREILVREGDHVQAGQPVLKLEPVQAQANAEMMSGLLYSSLALEARLLAERDGAAEIAWPDAFKNPKMSAFLAKLVDDENAQFRERRQTILGQIDIIESRKRQLLTEIEGINIEIEAAQKQVHWINKELDGLRQLLTKQLVPANRVYSMERERTRLEGVIGKLISDRAKAQSSVGEMDVQIAQIKQKFREDVASNLLDVRQKLNDYRQKNTVAEDVLRRIDLIAPRSGTVHNLKVFTLGQVVRQGEPLLDIVPDDDTLIIKAQFSPVDIDVVHAGQVAEIRFPAFHSRTIPSMRGVIEVLSQDRLVDEVTRQPYFLGTIAVAKADIPAEYKNRIRAGMPAEVLVAAGERTVLSYLTSPLSSALKKTFIEP